MSIFGTIMSTIFGHANASPAPSSTPAASPTSTSASPSSTSSTPAGSSSSTPVDVGAILTKLASQNKEKLDWQHSIVDLMKLLNLDSSLAARKTLATELHYTGNENDTATMNVWLIKQVMQKLAENGGRVPAGLQ